MSLRVLCVIKIISHPKQPWLRLPLTKAFLIWRFSDPFQSRWNSECKTGWKITKRWQGDKVWEETVQKPCHLTVSNVFLLIFFFSKVHFLLHMLCEAHVLWTPLQVLRNPVVRWWQAFKLITEGEWLSLERIWSWKHNNKGSSNFWWAYADIGRILWQIQG